MTRTRLATALAAATAGLAVAASSATAQPYTAPINLPGVADALAKVARSELPMLTGIPCPPGGTIDNGHSSSTTGGGATCRNPHTLTALTSFAVVNVELRQPPPVQYQLASTYAYYAARCAPAALGRPGAPLPAGVPLPQVLPRAPVLAGDTSITLRLSTPVGLSVYAPSGPQPKGMPPAPGPLAAAFGLAMVQGNGYAPASTLVLPQGVAPMLGDGTIVLAVAASYRLENASFGAFVVPAAAVIDQKTNLVLPMLGGVPVAGQFSGGTWGQGSGLLFIPAPAAMPAKTCDRGAFVAPVTSAVLGLYGIPARRPFEPPPGSVFIRTSAG